MAGRTALRWSVRAFGVVLALLLLGAAIGLWWVGQSTSFLRWSLERAVLASDGALEAGTVRGTLLGGFRIDSLRWHDDARELRLDDVAVALRPEALLRGEVRVSRVEIAQAALVLRPTEDDNSPMALPESLELPMAVRVDALGIGRLTIERESAEPSPPAEPSEPIVLERVSFAGRYRDGAWRVDRLAVVAPEWGEANMQGTLGARAPFDVEAVLEAAPRIELAAQPSLSLPRVRVLADGPLEDFSIVAQALPPPSAEQAQLARPVWIGVDTRVRPFAEHLADRLAPVELAFDAVEPAQFGLVDVPDLRLSGRATLRLRDAGVAGESAGVAGKFRIENTLPGALDANRIPLRALQGAFDWASSLLSLHELQAALPDDARIAGSFAVDLATQIEVFGRQIPVLRGEWRVDAVDLSQLQQQFERTRISGDVRVDRDRLELDLSDASRDDIGVAAALRIEAQTLLVERARLRSRAGTLEASGSTTVSAPWRVDLAGRFADLDPARVEATLVQFGVLEAPARLAQWSGRIGGSWSAKGQAWPEPSLDTRLAVESGQLAGESLRLQWRGAVTMTRIADVVASLDFGGAQASARGALGRDGDRLRFSARVDALQRFDARASGSASVEGELRGGWRDATLGVVGRVTGRGLAWGDTARVATLNGNVDLPDLSQGRVAVDLRANGVLASGRRLDRLRVRADGDIDAHTIRVDAAGPDLSGSAIADGGLQSEAAGAWRWEGRLAEFDATAPIALRLQAPASVQVDAGGASLGESAWRVDGAALNVASLAWRDGSYLASGDASGLPIGRWARRFAPATNAIEQADAELEVLTLDAQWELRGDDPSRPSGRVQLVLQGGRAGEQRGEADVVLDEGRLDGRVDLAIPTLAFADRIIGPAWAVAGRLRFSGALGGTVSAPRVNGELEGSELALLQRELGWRLTDGTLQAHFDGDRLVLRELRLQSGEGAITMTGGLLLDGLQGDFDLRADTLPVPLGPGERIVVSGATKITSRGTALSWSGDLRVDEGLIELRGGEAPTLPDDVVIVGKEAAPSPRRRAVETSASAQDPEGLHVAADLRLDLGEKLRIRGSGVDVLLAGSLELRGTLPANPLAFGTVRVARGTYSAYGQQLEITRGRVVFDGPIDNPVIDIVAMRTGLPVEAGVSVTGTVLSPRVRLVSNPEVPDAEKLSWLVLGVGFDDARSGAELAALRAAAASLMGSGDGVSGGLAQSLGLDVLTIRSANAGGVYDPDFGASFPGRGGTLNASPGAAQNVVAIGKRLSSRVLVTYEQGLRGVWNLLRIQLEITDRLSLRAQTGTDTALDLLYSFSFD